MSDELHVIDPDTVHDNIVQTFQLESTNLRGRIVRLGGTLDDILSAHDYRKPVAHLVAENITLTVLLGSMLKYEGIFTLQAQGDGPVKMLVADVTSDHKLRGCAYFDEERLQNAREQLAALETPEGSQHHLAQLLGKGYIAFTVDHTGHDDRYQGIVELKGASLVDCVQHYFTQSEQITTGIKMAVGMRDGQWRAAGIMLQHMPEDEKNDAAMSNISEDDWRRTMILLDSCTEEELLDPALNHNMLLMRLFHEEGVRVYDPNHLMKECRCSPARVEGILMGMSEDDRVHLADDGKITMHCEFCANDYIFDLKDIARKIKEHEKNT